MNFERQRQHNDLYRELLRAHDGALPERLQDEEIAALAEAAIESAEHASERFATEGQHAIDAIEQKSGLSNADVLAARREIHFPERWEQLQREASYLVDFMKNGFRELPAWRRREKDRPIGKHEPFFPEEELKRVKQASKEDRPRLLGEYKEKLAYQKEGLARLQQEVVRTVYAQPDIALGTLYKAIHTFGDAYGFTDTQKSVARELSSAYAERHMQVRAVREQYANDGELYEAAFDRKPLGGITVVEGPMTLCFRCSDIRDYASLRSGAYLQDRDSSESELEHAQGSAGCLLPISRIKGLEGALIAENTSVNEPGAFQNILKHEEQHAIDKLFRSVWRQRRTFNQIRHTSTEHGQILALKDFLRSRRHEIADTRAKDELLAYFRDGSSPERILGALTKPQAAGGLYDYLADEKKEREDVLLKVWSKEIDPDNIRKLVSDVYDREYRDALRSGINALQLLSEHGYSQDEAIALLAKEPLPKWTKAAKRLTHATAGKSAKQSISSNSAMEKKKPSSKTHLETLIPDKKRGAGEAGVQPATTDEETIRNEAWHGVKRSETKRSSDEKREQSQPAGPEHISTEKEEEIVTATREMREQEERLIATVAQEIFDKRMRGAISGTEVDRMLAERGIAPWTPEAEEFMRSWDWEQAQQELAQLAKEHGEASRRVHAASEALRPEQAERPVELSDTQEHAIVDRFAAFGISSEDLHHVDGFDRLSYGQRLLLAENLGQLTLGRVQEDALQQYHAETGQARFLGKIWNGITKQYQIAKREKATAEQIKHGGMQYHRDVLQRLVQGARDAGIDAIEGKDGLELQYIEVTPAFSERQQGQLREFNRIATAYAKVPYEWSLPTATREERQRFAAVESDFAKMREQALRTIEQTSDTEAALHHMIAVEGQIRMNQLLNTHPDAEDRLRAIESDAAWTKATKDIVTERGLQFGAGLATRTFATGLLGAIGMPIAAGAMGGWLARRRAAETLREEEIAARHGGKGSRKGMRKAVVTAGHLADRFRTSMEKIAIEEDETKRMEQFALLEVRLKHTEGKLRRGEIDFGSMDRRVANQYELVTLLADVSSALAMDDAQRGALPEDFKRDVERMLKTVSEAKDARVTEAKREHLRKQMIYGAGLGVVAFAAGYYVKDAIAGESAYAEVLPGGGGKTVAAHHAATSGEVRHVAAGATSGHEVVAVPAKLEGAEAIAIGKRGPEGAIIDYLKGHPDVAERLGIKDAGAAAHKLWTEDMHRELQRPETKELLATLGYSQDERGYAEMMRRIEHGTIALDERGGKLHMRFSDENTEYLRRVVHGGGIGRQVEPAAHPPVGQQIEPGAGQPAIDADAEFHKQQIEGILSEVPKVPRPSVEQYADAMFGLDADEYAAIKYATVEKLLREIPSRDQAWSIWRGEVPDPKVLGSMTVDEAKAIWGDAIPAKQINLPHDGIYGAMEFKKHIDLAEHIRSLRPTDGEMRQDVETFLRTRTGATGQIEQSVAHPAAVAVPAPEHVMTGQQVESSALHHTVDAERPPVGQQIEGITPALSSEKAALLQHDLYDDRTTAMRKLMSHYRVGNITPDDFALHYAQHTGAERPSKALLENVRMNFARAWGNAGTVRQQLAARRAIEVMVKRLQQ